MECSKLSWVSGLDGIKSVFNIKAVAYLVVGNISKKKWDQHVKKSSFMQMVWLWLMSHLKVSYQNCDL